MFDETFWVATGFIIFMVLSFKVIKKNVDKALSDKIAQTKKKLDEAEKIKQEALQDVQEIKKQYEQAVSRKALIAKQAEKKATHLIAEVHNRAEILAKKRLSSAIDMVERSKQNMVAQLRQEILSESINNVREVLVQDMEDPKRRSSLLEEERKNMLRQLVALY